MPQITIMGVVSPDGTLTAQVPATIPPGLYQIVVIASDRVTSDWPSGYFEATYGSIPDLERGLQGSYEQREELP